MGTSGILIRQNSIILVLRIMLLLVFFNIFYLITALLSDYIDVFNHTTSFIGIIAYDTMIYILLMLIQFFISVFLVLRWYNNSYRIDGDFIIHKSGIIFKKEMRLRLTDMGTVNYTQSFLGKIFQYGTLEFENLNNKKAMTLYAIADSEELINMLTRNSYKKSEK